MASTNHRQPNARGTLAIKEIDAGSTLHLIVCCLFDDVASPNVMPAVLQHFVNTATPSQLDTMLRYLCTGNTASPPAPPTSPRDTLLHLTLRQMFRNIHEELSCSAAFLRGLAKLSGLQRICCENGRVSGFEVVELPTVQAGVLIWGAESIAAFPEGCVTRQKLDRERDITSTPEPIFFACTNCRKEFHVRRGAITEATRISEGSNDTTLRILSKSTNGPIVELVPLAAVEPQLKAYLGHAEVDRILHLALQASTDGFDGFSGLLKEVINRNSTLICAVFLLKLVAETRVGLVGVHDRVERRVSSRNRYNYFSKNTRGGEIPLEQLDRVAALRVAREHSDLDLFILAQSRTTSFVHAVPAAARDPGFAAALLIAETREERPERLRRAEVQGR
ncbi:uncharacterized protein PAC_11720 [Phialocephala subalpina]|uniref:Uncharacterized protein n=1 Tax=Phialocephala subalpina TaxID=576137 RepID=A0A1L7X9W2_9HELO|nr:uncharacterized protein PAC_11720 [Phialocephala subalpina]